MSSRGRKYLLATLALTLAVAGCGGGEETASSADDDAASLTKAQFVKRGNAICRKAQEEVGNLNERAWKKYGPPTANPSQETLNKVALAMLPPKEKEVRLLRALGAPAGSEAYVDAMLTAWEEGIKKGKKDPAALQGGADWVFRKTYDMGLAYGLVDCWLS